MKKMRTLIIYILNIPLYLISKIVPKNEDIWVFGSWFGEKYADNSKYLFEYVNKNHSEIRAIWLTINKETLQLIQEKGYKVYYTYSLMGYLYASRAYFGFASTGFNDINYFIFSKFYINLWHGNPLKKVVYDDKLTNSIKYDSIVNKLTRVVFPFIHKPEDSYKIIASSEIEAKNLSTAFQKKTSDILITGLPRNDVFFQQKFENIKKIHLK